MIQKPQLPKQFNEIIHLDEENYLNGILKDQIYENEHFSHVSFKGVYFENCQFIHCEFYDCDFRDTLFKTCDFSNTEFQSSYFLRSCFIHTKLLGTNFTECSLNQFMIQDSLCRYLAFNDNRIKTMVLKEDDFSESFFENNQLKDVVFDHLNLTSASFFKTSLKGIDLSTSTLFGIAVSDTFYELKGAYIVASQSIDLIHYLGVKLKA